MFYINDIITYILSFFIPAIQTDIYIQQQLEQVFEREIDELIFVNTFYLNK